MFVMRILVASLAFCLFACGDDSGGNKNTGDASSQSQQDNCTLKNDTGAPGQYSDSCVAREFIADYVGTYMSGICMLTISTSGADPATFSLVVSSGDLAGTYTHAWEGGTGLGNDSYYRFTTDTTYTTTTALNFTAGKKVSDSEENSIRLRVDNVNTTATYSGGFSKFVSPATNQEVDCGMFTKS